MFLSGNPLLTSRVNILINVLDVNEFPPEISVPYETAVCENAKPGQVSYPCCYLRFYKDLLYACVLGYETMHVYRHGSYVFIKSTINGILLN